MSRESLLDEAIVKAKEAEDWQLVEWLRMARGGESAARWYTAKLGEARLDMSKLMTENAKLRELVHVLLQCRVEGDDICAKCNYRSPLHGGCMADVKADELGVEVNG